MEMLKIFYILIEIYVTSRAIYIYIYIYDRLILISDAFLFPIPLAVRLLLPPRPPPCMQLSVFPPFPALMLTFLAISAAVISYGNLIDIQNVIVLNS